MRPGTPSPRVGVSIPGCKPISFPSLSNKLFYQVRLAEDQELEEEKGDDSKDEGKTILKNKLPSCAE